MLRIIKKYFYNILERRKQGRKIHAREFRRIAQEIEYLADIAVKLNTEQERSAGNIHKIKTEMDRLSVLLNTSEFAKIPAESRLELRKNLMASRDQIMEAIHQAAPPTDILQ